MNRKTNQLEVGRPPQQPSVSPLRIALLLFLLGVGTACATFSQGWDHLWNTPTFRSLSHGNVLATQDGGYMAGYSVSDYQTHAVFRKTDISGDTLWQQTITHFIQDSLQLSVADLIQTADGGYAFVGYWTDSLEDRKHWAGKLDSTGQILWTHVYDFTYYGELNAVVECANGDLTAVGYDHVPNVGNHLSLTRLTALGDTVWTELIAPDTAYWRFRGQDLLLLPDGGFYLGAVAVASNPTRIDPTWIRTDSNGVLNWKNHLDFPGWTYEIRLTHAADGNVISALQTNHGGLWSHDLALAKTDLLGDTLWTQSYLQIHPDIVRDVIETPDSGIVIVGEGNYSGGLNWDIALNKFDVNGNRVWERFFGGLERNQGMSVCNAHDGGFVLIGYQRAMGALKGKTWLIKVDSLGYRYTNVVEGDLFIDANLSCSLDSGEFSLSGWMVEVDSGAFRTFADSLGHYSIRLDSGVHTMKAVNPSPYMQVHCPGGSGEHSVLLSTYNQLTGLDFAFEVGTPCPWMQVEIAAPFIRWCDTATYHVLYTNQGTISADSAYIEVELDSFMSVIASTVPWRVPQSGNTYVFDVGDVHPAQSGAFQFQAVMDCDSTVVGQTHCTSAHIYPDSSCEPTNPGWDASSLRLSIQCLADTAVRFVVTNVGSGNMLAPVGAMVLEDNILHMDTTVQLATQNSWTYQAPANGSTWILRSGQPLGHPGNSFPITFKEGCGTNINGSFSLGIAPLLPQNDLDNYISIDCQASVASYDPNDKIGWPLGQGPNHYIELQDELEYQIRFQNTGNDTAFSVIVIDTLSPHLDVTTLVPGASSHPYTLSFDGPNILRWTFLPIVLPDSNINEPASHGFFRFRIQKQPGLALGTRIENSASIYFDYNAPVLTNTTWHTLEEGFWGMVSLDPVLDTPAQPLTVYPNPFHTFTTFDLGETRADYQFELYDLQGQLQIQHTYRQVTQFRFERAALPPGLYLFRITGPWGVSKTGRIMIR